jgi:isopenicillin-N N-acyltransferase-like protein
MGHGYVRVEVRGTHREVGRAVGEAAREQVRRAVEYYRSGFPAMAGIEFSEAERQVVAYLECARRVAPLIVEEMEGTAEGAGVALEEVAVLTCGEEFTCLEDPAQHCTSLAATDGGSTVAGHNEDWYAGDVDENVFLDATLPDGTRFLAMTAAGYLPATGLSSHGIAGGANTLFSTDVRIGVPNLVVRRWALEAPTLEEASRRATHPDRARGSNHLFADAAGRILNIEASASAHAARWVEPEGSPTWFAHTNRFLEPEMQTYELSTSTNSVRRLERAQELLTALVRPGADLVAVAGTVLRDHATAPDSICSHPNRDLPEALREMTCASQVWDLSAGAMHVCAGPPCESSYDRYSL